MNRIDPSITGATRIAESVRLQFDRIGQFEYRLRVARRPFQSIVVLSFAIPLSVCGLAFSYIVIDLLTRAPKFFNEGAEGITGFLVLFFLLGTLAACTWLAALLAFWAWAQLRSERVFEFNMQQSTFTLRHVACFERTLALDEIVAVNLLLSDDHNPARMCLCFTMRNMKRKLFLQWEGRTGRRSDASPAALAAVGNALAGILNVPFERRVGLRILDVSWR